MVRQICLILYPDCRLERNMMVLDNICICFFLKPYGQFDVIFSIRDRFVVE